ncbi:MAG TPA: tyrosine-protein phosphatase [Candidatus Dormibacteraeota bacterium]|nr:tyrosine-protein phosphatase [Candidatus Dormibacteraeota bacterium]
MIGSPRTRTITWDGCVNVRDLGGLPTEDGGETRSGRIIRADNLGALTAGGWRSLQRHGIERIVDLRWPEEAAEDPPRGVAIEVVPVSVLGETMEASLDYLRELDAHLDSVDDVADHYAWSYVEFLERNRERFGQAFVAIAEADGPVVIHCMGGKDRTGLVAALLLRLAGVSLDEIGRDYALSGPNLALTLESWLDDAPTAVDRRRREKLSQTPADTMRRVIPVIEARHGSVAGYLQAGGLSTAQVERLRTRLR